MTVARRLARWRVPLGFVFGALAFGLALPTPDSLAAGGVVALLGEALRLWAAGHLEKSREVTTSGPYRWTRHPLYVGSSLLGVGLAIASRRWEVAALVGLYLATTLTAAVRSEETFLSSRFGEAYAQYREGRLPVADRRFSWRRAMSNREYRAAGGLVLVFLLLAWKAAS
jgi:protein-S-isoprenylcysteine O-methyltransferase Ste14